MAPDSSSARSYDPRSHSLLSFHDRLPAFEDRSDTPRAYLERCLSVIDALEGEVKAFAALNIEGARAAADDSTARYKEGRARSPVDGMPFGVKDLYETIDMPTQMNSPKYDGWQGNRDSAHVFAMREGGAVILGKTTTTEFGAGAAPPTRNPFDTSKTAGGSSSGSSAAVGAGMLPAASGSQVRGSIVRPAGYCANYALKPSYGALNRGGAHALAPSQSVLGVHAGTLEDCWRTAFYISNTAGGDPGTSGLIGSPKLDDPRTPKRLVRLETAGWAETTEATKAAFEVYLGEVRNQGVAIVDRTTDAGVEALEQALTRVPDLLPGLLGFEAKWPMADYEKSSPGVLGEKMQRMLKSGRDITIERYRELLAVRSDIRAAQESLRGHADAFVLLCSQDPPPDFPEIGDTVYGDVSSTLGAPAFVLPVLAVEGLPVGILLMGWPGDDFALTGLSRWLMDAFRA